MNADRDPRGSALSGPARSRFGHPPPAVPAAVVTAEGFTAATADPLSASGSDRSARTLDVLPQILRTLRLRGVPAVVTRGLGIGEVRSSGASGRVEVLVPPGRFLQAHRTLSALGFHGADGREPRSYFRRSCREGVTLARDDGPVLVLDHHLRPWAWGARVPFAEIERRSRERALPTGTVRAVHPLHGLLIASLRALDEGVPSEPGTGAWREVAELSSVSDPASVASVARGVELDRLLAWTLRRLPAGVRPDALLRELGDEPLPVPDQIRLRLLLHPGLRARGDLAQACRLPTAPAVAFLAGYVLPSPSFLEHRFGSALAYATWWGEAFTRAETHPGTDPRASAAPERGPDDEPPEERDRGAIAREPRDASSGRGAEVDWRGATLFRPIGPVTEAALFGDLEGSPPAPSDPSAWDRELPALLHHRLAGLALAAALRNEVQLHEETRSQLHASQLRSTARALAVESTALEAIGALDARGIPAVVTKGPGIATAYPQRSLRPYGDLDALVHPEWFEVALRVLHTLGYEEYFDGGEPRSYFDRYCREGVNLVREDGGSIDLHHHVPPWVFGERLRFAQLYAASSEEEVAGGRVRVVDPAHNLLIAALHVISDRRVYPGHKLLTWRDVVTLAHACDAEVAATEARRMELDWYLAFILRQVPASMRPRALVQRLGHPRLRRTDAFRLRRLLPPGIGSRHQIAQAFRLPLPNAGLFLAGYVVPSREFLERRFGSRRAYLAWWRDAFLRFRASGTTGPTDLASDTPRTNLEERP
jgi:hypothetical protein